MPPPIFRRIPSALDIDINPDVNSNLKLPISSYKLISTTMRPITPLFLLAFLTATMAASIPSQSSSQLMTRQSRDACQSQCGTDRVDCETAQNAPSSPSWYVEFLRQYCWNCGAEFWYLVTVIMFNAWLVATVCFHRCRLRCMYCDWGEKLNVW